MIAHLDAHKHRGFGGRLGAEEPVVVAGEGAAALAGLLGGSAVVGDDFWPEGVWVCHLGS